MSNEGRVPFKETWGFPSEVKKALGASWYEVIPSEKAFASGRARLDVVFYGQGYGDNRAVLATRPGMELTSQKGEKYIVCRRQAEAPKRAREPREGKAPPRAYEIGDVFDGASDDGEAIPPPLGILKRS
jgi:hypothetical protein